MTSDAFNGLLRRRDELQAQHTRACEILEEEPRSHYQYRRCCRIYDELAAVQQQIDDELAAERAAENATDPTPHESPPSDQP